LYEQKTQKNIMKKLLYILFSVCLLTACGGNEENSIIPTTEPEKGDAVTTEQIIGTYKASYIKFDNTDEGLFKDNLELTFNADQTGEERNPRTLEKTPFTWSYNDRVISFSYSLHKNVKGWFDKSNLKYRAYYINSNGKPTERIATHIFVKK
jgi:hypothetical protein